MRHPDDPDPIPDSKAVAALCLGILGALTGVMLGGAIPATVALVLAGQASSELVDGQGWRTGTGYVLWARRTAWLGIGLAVAASALLVTVLLLQGAGGGQRDFPPNID